MNTTQEITGKATASVKWAALGEAVTRTASPLVLVILARLLTPFDFGLVSTATIAISFCRLFWEAGLGKALIQSNESQTKVANVVFWSNLALGICIYVILFCCAPALAVFFKSPESAPIVRVLGIQIIIGSFTVVQQSLFERDLAFKKLFGVKFITAFTPGLFSIPLAFYGLGVWALVAGNLAGSLVNMLVLWNKSPWRPSLGFDWSLAKKIFSFGIWVLAEGVGSWFIIWGDNLLVARYLGIEDLGVYRVAWNCSTIIFGVLLNPFLPILFPTFSRIRNDKIGLKNAFEKANKAIFFLALPIGTGLLLLAPDIVSLAFGTKWHHLGFVLSIIGFMNGIAWLVGINPEVYRAMGRPDWNTKLLLFTILYYFPVFLITAPMGLHVFVYARLCVALVSIPLHVFLAVKILGVSPLYLYHEGKYFILSSIAMAGGVFLIKSGMHHIFPNLKPLVAVPIYAFTGIIAYFGSLWILDKTTVLQLKGMLTRAAVAK